MTNSKAPNAPAGLARAGRNLWRALVSKYEFAHAGELAVLEAACRQLDAVTDLEAAVKGDGLTVPGAAGQPRMHPAVAEARQGRLALSRLLADLRIPGDDQGTVDRRTSEQARRAAQARWQRPRAERAG